MVLPLVIISATTGSVLGAYILYGIGWVLSRERLMRFFETRPMRPCSASRDPTLPAPSIGSTARGRRRSSSAAASPSCASPHIHPRRHRAHEPGKVHALHARRLAVWNTVLCSLGAAAGSAWMQVSEQAEWVSDIVKYVIIALVIVAAIFWIVKRIIPNLKKGA